MSDASSHASRHPAMKSRADTYEGVAAAACKERLPGHAVLRGLLSAIEAAASSSESHGEHVPPSVTKAVSLLREWCDGFGRERDLAAVGAALEEEREAYVRLWNERMKLALERRAAGEDSRYPVSTFARHLSDATAFCLALAPRLVPGNEPCAESTLRDALKDVQATLLVLGGDRTMASDRAAGRAMASAFRAGVRSAPLRPPPPNYVLIPPKTQAQLDFEERRRRERFMGAFGYDEDPTTTLLGCPVPPPEDGEAGRTARVADSAFEDLGLVRRYAIDEVLEGEAMRKTGTDGATTEQLKRAMARLGIPDEDPEERKNPGELSPRRRAAGLAGVARLLMRYAPGDDPRVARADGALADWIVGRPPEPTLDVAYQDLWRTSSERLDPAVHGAAAVLMAALRLARGAGGGAAGGRRAPGPTGDPEMLAWATAEDVLGRAGVNRSRARQLADAAYRDAASVVADR